MAELVNKPLEEILQSGNLFLIYLGGTDPGYKVLTKDEVQALINGSLPTGASGDFTTVDGKTVTVVNGIITSIV